MTKRPSQTDRYPAGRLVISKKGRDKDRVYVVVGSDAAYIYVADGVKWKRETPKKKNRKHLQPVNRMAAAEAETEVPGEEAIREAIRAFAGRDL